MLVTVTQYATQNVTVFGQVAKPGNYTIDTPRSVVDVPGARRGINRPGGPACDHRAAYQPSADILLCVEPPSDFLDQTAMVNPGDKVMVPKAGIVYVLGDVARPGGYPMTNNDGTLTVLQAVAAAGGTASSAAPNSSRLIRRTAVGGYQSDPFP